MSRLDNAKKGIIAGFINNVLAIVLPFVSRTIILYTLGNAYAGLGGLFTSIINVLNISELGFGAAVSYILYKPVAEGDDEKVRAILNFTRKCFRVIGTIILIAGLAIMPFLQHLIKSDVPDGLNIYILFAIYLVNVVLSYWTFAYKRLLFSANQRYDVETKIASIVLVLQYVVQILVLLVLKNYYLYVVVFAVMTFVNNLLCHTTTKKMFPQYFCRGQIDKTEVKVLKQKIGGSFFAKVGETVYLSVDNIVISAFFGLMVLGKYGNYYYVISSLLALFAVLHNTLRPIIGNCIVLENAEANFKRLSTLNHAYLWCSAFCTGCLLVLYQDFITVWVGAEATFTMDIVLLLAIYFFTGRLTCIPTLFVEAAGLWWESKFFSLIAATLNLTLNIILSRLIGLPGILISSIVSSLAVTLCGYVWVLFKHYFNEPGQFWGYLRNTLGIVIGGGVSIAAVYFLCRAVPAHSWLMLIVKGALVAAAFGAFYVVINCKNQVAKETWRMVYAMFLSKVRKK